MPPKMSNAGAASPQTSGLPCNAAASLTNASMLLALSTTSSSSPNTMITATNSNLSPQQLALQQQQQQQQLLALMTPKPSIQLYLDVATRVFPRVEKQWAKMTANCVQTIEKAEQERKAVLGSLDGRVKQFLGERQELERDIDTVKGQRQKLRDAIVSDNEQFAIDFAKNETIQTERVAKLKQKLDFETAQAEEANRWDLVRVQEKNKLHQLRLNIERVELNHQKEVAAMNADHEAAKRKLRDALVKRLRRARDATISLQDGSGGGAAAGGDGETTDKGSSTAAAGGGGNANGTTAGAGSSSSGTSAGNSAASAVTRRNEILAREVSIHYREAQTLQQAIRDLTAEEQSLRQSLKDVRTQNERLLERNASHAKTKKILTEKLAELRRQLAQVEAKRATTQREKTQALRSTTLLQGVVIDELNDEIDVNIERLDALRRQLRATQAVAVDSDVRTGLAMRFLMRCSSSMPPPRIVPEASPLLAKDHGFNHHHPSDGDALMSAAPPSSIHPPNSQRGLSGAVAASNIQPRNHSGTLALYGTSADVAASVEPAPLRYVEIPVVLGSPDDVCREGLVLLLGESSAAADPSSPTGAMGRVPRNEARTTSGGGAAAPQPSSLTVATVHQEDSTATVRHVDFPHRAPRPVVWDRLQVINHLVQLLES